MLKCNNCNQEKEEVAIYRNRQGHCFCFCKDCITKIDLFNIDSYKWFFRILDLPYFQYEWNCTIDYCKRNYPEKMPAIVFRKYLGKMRLASYKPLKFSNSDFIIEGEK